VANDGLTPHFFPPEIKFLPIIILALMKNWTGKKKTYIKQFSYLMAKLWNDPTTFFSSPIRHALFLSH
jgi:hypothetical protein